jgi:hypothetical protein
MALSASRIDWQPTAGSEHLTLTIAGPDGLWLHREFEAGQPASLSLSEPEGERLPDGSYTWELRATPSPGKLSQKSLVESGHFFVKDGSFVAARKKAPAATQRTPRLITAESSIDGPLAVIGNACIGTSCTSTSYDYSTLTLKATQPNILFDDDFVEGGGTPHDWALFINPSSAAEFSVADFENGLIPFTIAGGAPNSSLYVSGNGNVGLGTATPNRKLHLITTSATDGVLLELQNNGPARIRFTNATSGETWNAGHQLPNGNGFVISDTGDNVAEMYLDQVGNVAFLGTVTSTSSRVSGSTGTAQSLIEETNATTANRTLLELKNNGGSRLNLTDSSSAATWGINNFSGNLNLIKSGTGFNAAVLQGNGNLTIAGTLTQGSDRDTKRDVVPVQPEQILAKVASLPITTWNRKTDQPSVRHMGPMAQDFAAVFGLGDDDRHIAVLDIAGVSLASIQALSHKITAVTAQKDEEIAQLRRENAQLAQRLAALEALIRQGGKNEGPTPDIPPTP